MDSKLWKFHTISLNKVPYVILYIYIIVMSYRSVREERSASSSKLNMVHMVMRVGSFACT